MKKQARLSAGTGDRWYSLPALIIVAITTQVPFVITIVYSFLSQNFVRPDQGIKFVGFSNYAKYITDTTFWQVVWQTILFVGVALLICLVFGYIFSVILDSDVPMVNLSRTLILTPFFLMSTATGVVWRAPMLNSSFGWYAKITTALGMPTYDLFGSGAQITMILLMAWQWLPFFVLVMVGGLQNVPTDVIESSKIDGCNWWVTTFKIKLPMILGQVQVAVMLGLLFLFKEYGLILTTTAGGPGKNTYTLTYYIYKIMYSQWKLGETACVAVITVAIMLFAVSMLTKLIAKRRATFE